MKTVKRSIRHIGLGVLLLFSGGCAAALVGGLIYKSSKSGEQKQEFMAQLQRTNADRESKGLKPLDWCSEAYRFDKGWAFEDPNCQARIRRYEKGDSTALDTPIAPKPDSANHK